MIKGICEWALNTLKGTITLTPGQKKKLIKHRHLLRRLCDKNCRSWKSKKRLIVQKGDGFLTALLGPVLSTVLSVLLPSRANN